MGCEWEAKREVLVRVDEESDPRYGCPPEKRPMQAHLARGVVNVDKPAGPTSHQVVAWVRQIFGTDQAGHGGTLGA